MEDEFKYSAKEIADMLSPDLKITDRTIRFYECKGILPEPKMIITPTKKLKKVYSKSIIKKLMAIRELQLKGKFLADIKEEINV